MNVTSWYDGKGRWHARHLCGDPPRVSEWQAPEVVSDAPVWVELRCGFCRGEFVTVIESTEVINSYRNATPPTF